MQSFNQWKDGETDVFDWTDLLCSCRYLKDYIDEFAEEKLRGKLPVTLATLR